MPDAPQHSVRLPSRMAHLARDHRGFVVPFFVAWMKDGQQVRRGQGVPDFRIVDPEAMIECVNRNRCWLCGDPLGSKKAFVLGPMCVITRVNSEPPSHRECAEYAMKVCPFLSRPNMRRNSGYDGPVIPAAGEHSEANPGVMALWITDGAELFNADWGQPGVLFQVHEPREVVWWREGRHATVEEVTLGLAKAMPALEMQAAKKGRGAIKELEWLSARALNYLPGKT